MTTTTSRNRLREFILCLVIALLSLSLSVPLFACSGETSAQGDDNKADANASQSEQTENAGEDVEGETTLSDLKAYYLDVGQGDSEALQLPDGKWMLVDAGDADHGSTVVDFLKNQGVERIDYLVATHPHADHIGGMVDVLSSFDVGELWLPDASTDTETFNSFLDAVEKRDVTTKEAKRGEVIVPASSGYEVTVLGPADGTQSDDMNDYSAVIKVTYGDTSLLLTGDATAQEIVDDSPGHVDVLKAAHHGSETGTTTAVLDAITPTYVIMSYEEGNSYGHPDQSVLDAISSAGCTAYSTAANGNVTATSNGQTVSVTKSHDGTITAGVSAAERQRQADEAKAKAEEEAKAKAAAEEKARLEAEAKAQAEARAKAEAEAAAQAEAQRKQQEAEAAAAAAQQQQQQAETVYVTRTGKKYHRYGCQYLRKSCIPISLDDAINQGYTPCSKCF